MQKEKLPQNIQHLLMEIGEKMVLFKLFLLVKDTEWNVYQNIGEIGCDLLLLNGITNQKLKIEVKTRQRLYSTSKGTRINIAQFTITETEYISCDFVVCYWLEENVFFIVPKTELAETSSNGKPLYKFIVKRRLTGGFDENSTHFLDKWDTIIRKS
jgi:hypothetical protein